MMMKKLSKIYEIAMAILALIVILLLIVELSFNLSDAQIRVLNTIDGAILAVFILDYFTRLALAKHKLVFIKENVIDLVAIIPFSSVFRAARLVRVFRIARLAKLSKATRIAKLTKVIQLSAYLGRFFKKVNKFLKTNNFNYVLLVSITLIILGAIGLYFTENLNFEDALWWAFVTATTVGYGDISPTTSIGRIIAAILMLVGIGLIGMLTGTIATYFIKPKEVNYKHQVLNNIKEQLDKFDDLTSDDIDMMCEILKTIKKEKEVL